MYTIVMKNISPIAEEVILAEERTTEAQRFHIIDARRRSALKMRKLKTLGKVTKKEDEEEEEDEPDETSGLSSQMNRKPKTNQKEGLRRFWVWEKRIR